MTKLIGITELRTAPFNTVVAACEDGSVYRWDWEAKAWILMAAVPGTEAASVTPNQYRSYS